MLRIYGLVRENEHGNLHYFDFMGFYLRKADAEADVKNCNEKSVKVIPLEVNEIYEHEEE